MNPLTPCCHFTSGDLEGGCYQTESVLDDAYMYVLGSVFAFLTIPCYIIFCFMVRCFREKRRNVTTMERSLDEGDEDDLVVFDEGSVYSYFVTDMPLGWLIAFVSLGLQFAILFLLVSFTDDGEIQNWTCPSYSDVCVGTSYANSIGWAIYWVLMILYCAKDVINGAKMIYHSSSKGYPCWKRIRFFCGGCGLFSVALVAISVSSILSFVLALCLAKHIFIDVLILYDFRSVHITICILQEPIPIFSLMRLLFCLLLISTSGYSLP